MLRLFHLGVICLSSLFSSSPFSLSIRSDGFRRVACRLMANMFCIKWIWYHRMLYRLLDGYTGWLEVIWEKCRWNGIVSVQAVHPKNCIGRVPYASIGYVIRFEKIYERLNYGGFEQFFFYSLFKPNGKRRVTFWPLDQMHANSICALLIFHFRTEQSLSSAIYLMHFVRLD